MFPWYRCFSYVPGSVSIRDRDTDQKHEHLAPASGGQLTAILSGNILHALYAKAVMILVGLGGVGQSVHKRQVTGEIIDDRNLDLVLTFLYSDADVLFSGSSSLLTASMAFCRALENSA